MAIIKNKFTGNIEAGSNSRIVSDATYGNPDYSIITGGLNNRICAAAHSFIGTGSGNYISKWNTSGYVFIGTGCDNTAGAGAIVSGGNNSIGWGAPFGFIGGGTSNSLSAGCNGVIVGGAGNSMNSNRNSFIGGGSTNSAAGVASTVGAGLCNNASGSYSTVAGGRQNTASAYTFIGGVSKAYKLLNYL